MSDKAVSIKFLIFFFPVFFTSCSTLRDAGVPAPEMETTETGIATGVVLGAGIGAIVGSTAGQAGAGAVVGGVAGGATGGVIGKALEVQEKRIEAHDQKLGMDTRPTGGASMRSRLWAPADETEYSNNRPSGDRGVAARHVSSVDSRAGNVSNVSLQNVSPQKRYPSQVTQIQRDTSDLYASRKDQSPQREVSRVLTEEPINTKTSANSLGAASAPRIELEKPRAELPPAQGLPPMRRPSFENARESAGENAQRSSLASPPQGTEKRIALTPPPSSRVPSKQAPSRQEVEKKNKEEVKAKVALQKTAAPQTVTPVTPAKKTATTSAVKSTCEKGKSEVARARSAASDSDKVFYFRRAILACPEDSSLRVELGKIYARLGLKEDARKEFTKALDFDPSNESAQDELSIMMLDSHASN